ncbi:MAG: hypothetical protein PHS92_02205 [Candidatus Gracilibacteria bacterium]|nr:hypothetical protein [Candidatus Gracilibacteria bacterium]
MFLLNAAVLCINIDVFKIQMQNMTDRLVIMFTAVIFYAVIVPIIVSIIAYLMGRLIRYVVNFFRSETRVGNKALLRLKAQLALSLFLWLGDDFSQKHLHFSEKYITYTGGYGLL